MKTKFRNIFAVIMVVVLFITTIPAMNAAAVKLKSLDLAFIIDTTGSMSSIIEEVKANMRAYLNDLKGSGMDFRVAVIDYRDFSSRGDSNDYAYKIQCDFTNDYDTILAAINGLDLGYGGDNEETIYSAIVDGLDELSWRSTAGKSAILIGDAAALDPEPFTGYTIEDASDALIGGSRSTIALFSIATSNNTDTIECFKALSEPTGGISYTINQSDEISKIIFKIIDTIPEVVETPSGEIEYFIKGNDKEYVSVKIPASISDSEFAADSKTYNHALAQFCSKFMVVGYTSPNGSNKEASNYLSKNQVMANALGSMGFSSDALVDLNTGRDEVNYFIASKKIISDGKQYDLVFAGFIGSNGRQWNSNFDPYATKSSKDHTDDGLKGKVHLGFDDARDFVFEKLTKYIDAHGFDPDTTKFLITGHSRGAATANLVAADLIKGAWNESGYTKYAEKENIFTYTFATPNVTSNEETTKGRFARIYNIVNPEDFVTKVLFADWDFSRYGTTYTLPSKTNTFYLKYRVLRNRMNKEFAVLTNGEEYENYIKGEKTVYKIVDAMTKTVGNLDNYYDTDYGASFGRMSPFEFFQETLCPFVNNTQSESELTDAALNIINILSYNSDDNIYVKIIAFFGLEQVVSKNFEQSHQMETYCAYMMTLSSDEVKREKEAYKNTVNCPVDIEVIEKETGEVVGKIVDNSIDQEIEAKENSVVMDVEGDSKTFWLPSDGDYEIRLTGNDEGTMDYTVSEVDSDLGETSRINFFDVEIEDGLKLTGEMDGETFELEEFELEYESGKKLSPTEQIDSQSEKVTVYTEAIGNGFVSPTMSVTRGDYVTVSAIAEDGNSYFVEWYDLDTGETLSNDAEYSFVAKENINLGAYFYTNEFFVFEPSTYNINYGDILVLEAYKGDLPEGAQLIWYTEGNSVDAWSYWDDDSVDYVEGIGSGYSTIYVEVVDEYGNPILDGEGNPYNDAITVYCNGSFIMRLISFFKNLFGIDRYVY